MPPLQLRRHSDLQCTCSTWQHAQLSAPSLIRDDTETVEHAYARHTLPHGPSPSATSTPRRLHTHAPSPTHLPRAALPRACQMSRCSTGRRLMRTQLVRRLAAGARARSANGIDARARSANGIDAERVARRRRWRPAEAVPSPRSCDEDLRRLCVRVGQCPKSGLLGGSCLPGHPVEKIKQNKRAGGKQRTPSETCIAGGARRAQ